MSKLFFLVALVALLIGGYYSSSIMKHDVIENYGMVGTITARILSVSLRSIELQACEKDDGMEIESHSFLIAELDRYVTIYYGSKSYTTNKLILTFKQPYTYTKPFLKGGILKSTGFDEIGMNFRNEIPQAWDYYVATEFCLAEERQPAIGSISLHQY